MASCAYTPGFTQLTNYIILQTVLLTTNERIWKVLSASSRSAALIITEQLMESIRKRGVFDVQVQDFAFMEQVSSSGLQF